MMNYSIPGDNRLDVARTDWDDVLSQVRESCVQCAADRLSWVGLAASLRACVNAGAPEETCWQIFHTISLQSPAYIDKRDCMNAWNIKERESYARRATPGTFVKLFHSHGCKFKRRSGCGFTREAGSASDGASTCERYVEPEGQFEATTDPRELAHSILLTYLLGIMPRSRGPLMKVWSDYRVGFNTRSNRELFRYYDADGTLRNIKSIKYVFGSHRRDRSPKHEPRVYGGCMACFFGEHLLTQDCNRDKPVCIVESEKTALVMAVCIPRFVWLATGGGGNIHDMAARIALEGRCVIICPDVDMVGQWDITAKKVEPKGWLFAPRAVPCYLDVLQSCDAGDHADIADAVLEYCERRAKQAGLPPSEFCIETQAARLRCLLEGIENVFATVPSQTPSNGLTTTR